MMSIEEFNQKYPKHTVILPMGKEFSYRYYRNPDAKSTVLLLSGGIGLSDLFYLHFDRFAKYFSVLTFDYQIQFKNNMEFALAVSQLLQNLDEKVWLVGQSLGGIVSQIIASYYPECVEGMILSNTCSLAKDMGEDAYQFLLNMIEGQKKAKKLLSFIPFALYKWLIKWAVLKKKTDGFTQQEKMQMKNLCNVMMKLLDKPYEYHMIDFLVDAQNHFGMTENDFRKFDDRVLLILSEDDHTFNQACKDSLVNIMTNPTLITNLHGGHLALMVQLDEYARKVSEYILKREK